MHSTPRKDSCGWSGHLGYHPVAERSNAALGARKNQGLLQLRHTRLPEKSTQINDAKLICTVISHRCIYSSESSEEIHR